ncbi:DUF438 domain-containing protein [Bacillaceae bacterium S4-13-58]
MSEIINNREVSIQDKETEGQKEFIKQMLKELHRDEPVDQIKERYKGILKNIKVSEMSQMYGLRRWPQEMLLKSLLRRNK